MNAAPTPLPFRARDAARQPVHAAPPLRHADLPLRHGCGAQEPRAGLSAGRAHQDVDPHRGRGRRGGGGARPLRRGQGRAGRQGGRGTVRAAGAGGRPPAAAVMTAPLESAATAGFAGSRARFETVLGWLESAEAGTGEHAELEAHLQADACELFRQLYQDHLDLRAEREPRIAAVADAEGVGHGSAEPGHTRGLATVFGPVQVTRIAYRARGQANLHPADGGLNLPADRYSHGLRRLAAIEAARGSFDGAVEAIERGTGQQVGKRQVEELAQRSVADFDAFYSGRQPPAGSTGDALVLSCDGKGVVMRPDALRAATAAAAAKTSPKLTTRLSKGENRNRTRMAEVGTVYDATPTPRTPADILPATEEERREAAAGPVPANKWLMASVVEDAASVVGRIFDEAASSGSARFAATATSKTTGATTSPRNATASTSPATPATSFRTRREAPPEEPHPIGLVRRTNWEWRVVMARTNIKPVSESSAKLGAYLQQLRLERRLTMRGLAARAKVDFSYVSRLEHGLVGAPTARQLWKIARALDIEVADLYSEAGFVDAHGLPGFGPYLRAKYQLPDDAVAQLQAHFALINEKYHATRHDDVRDSAGEAADA